jgi:hypothetical protein
VCSYEARGNGKRRAAFYACSAFHRKGRAICANSLEMRIAEADDAVVTALEKQLLNEGIIAKAAARTAALRQQTPAGDLAAQRTALASGLNRCARSWSA